MESPLKRAPFSRRQQPTGSSVPRPDPQLRRSVVGRLVRSRAGIAVVVALLSASVASVVTAGASDEPNAIHGCVAHRTGALRIVSDSTACTPRETPISWNQQGVPGPAGPPGISPAAGTSCPAGEFVTGIATDGSLLCAAATDDGSGGGDTGGGDTGGGLRCTDADGDGSYDTPPPLPNAQGSCDLLTGEVFLAECYSDYHDLNGDLADGCEYGPVPFTGSEVCDGLDNDADGMVDDGIIVPTAPNTDYTCDSNLGMIVMTCHPGFEDANGDMLDGCEAETTVAP